MPCLPKEYKEKIDFNLGNGLKKYKFGVIICRVRHKTTALKKKIALFVSIFETEVILHIYINRTIIPPK